MAESDKPEKPRASSSSSKSYIPSFLFRRGNKGGKRGKTGVRRVLEVREADVVSKSVDSLLAVASSISLPPHAVLRAENLNSETFVESAASGNGGISPCGHAVRRHSYDVNALHRDTSEEFFDCPEGHRQDVASDGDVTASSSSEASPRHFPRSSIARSSYDSQYGQYGGASGISSPCVRRVSDIIGRARAATSSLGGTASRGGSSSRDSLDLESDLDDRGYINNQIFCPNSSEATTSLPGSPIIKVERKFQQVGALLAFFCVVFGKN
ncbi:hypothetical protein EGW08_014525 [Elysia chlorotica]|uniref:Uncharacterized protein n=1 Tax=Elysia chlorotica TaxID=188477 RepID=A0A433T833_ELYCH|nr:hypothetical protein EGW08_014525 [Elysia chlorotica]